jgi:peptidoglycan hydrolase-like protein with peptidoglycan-binding domain
VKQLRLCQRSFLKRLTFTLLPLIALVLFSVEPCDGAESQTLTTTISEKATTSAAVKKRASNARRRKKSRKPIVRGQRTIEPARVVEIQSALAAAGYYDAEPTGEWDESTSKAMSTYQQNNGFKTTGKPDALSLKKLGL